MGSFSNDLHEKVYMTPPPSYDHAPHKVCRLLHALYGLKQAPRAWFAKFCSTISQLNFSSSSFDSTLVLKKSTKGTVLLLLYVDDIIITSDDLDGIANLKKFLSLQLK